MRRLRLSAFLLILFALVLWLLNSSRFAAPIGERPVLLAHRGLAQDFDRAGLGRDTCTAARMIRAGHDYLENTIASMRAAFEMGAGVVEFDVHPTTDGRFAVFHDWVLDCRTEGSGVTREQSLADLQALDIGYGYTADGGQSFPFRGKGVGLMPSLEEVLTTFPDRDFLLEIKGNDLREAQRLASHLRRLIARRTGEVMVYGPEGSVSAIRQALPGTRTMTRPDLKKCMVRYLALGWTGFVPDDCRNRVLFVPANYARWMWGWPNRFLRRMHDHGSGVFLIGDYRGEGFSHGFDDPGRIAELPVDYAGGIWTDRLERIAPAVAEMQGRKNEIRQTGGG